MATNFDEWQKQMKANQQKTMEAINKTINSAAKELFETIIDRTPEGNPSLWKYPAPKDYQPGTLRASWTAAINGGAPQQQYGGGINMTINTKQATITFENNQPYAWRVEYGAWSTQAPAGMMRISVEEYTSKIDKFAREYKL